MLSGTKLKASINLQGIASSKRTRCCFFFLAAGIGIGAWAASLPLLAAKLAIDKGVLGLVLLCFAAGAIVLMVSIGRFIDRVGSDLLSLAGCLFFGLSVIAVANVGSVAAVSALVLAAGAGFGTLDVSMNTTASYLERESKRHLMSSFHALFSVGNLVGAFLVGKVVAYGMGIEGCLSLAGAFVIVTALLSRSIGRQPLKAPSQASGAHAVTSPKLSPLQVLLVCMFGGIGFLSMLGEGGMMDWTAVYLVNNLAASESVAAYAFGVFAGAMAVGRFAGDVVVSRIGHVNVIRIGSFLCATSIAAMLLAQTVPVTLASLALCGLGVSNLVPAVFASAGHLGGNAAGKAMSIVTTLGYSGLLLGPAFLGFIAQSTALTVSFATICFAFAVISIATFYVRKQMVRYGVGFVRSA